MSTRTALVTGAASGIGKALVEKLDREGWRCFAGYNRQPPDALLETCSDRTQAVQCNVTDGESVKSALEEVGGALAGGALDLLVNNAATTGGAGGGVENVDIDRFKSLFEVNFWGQVRVTQAALPFIRRSEDGRIINVGSASQYLTIPMGCSYPISKAALKRLTQALRVELKPFGVQVTCVEPGGVRTPMIDISEEQRAELWASFPEHLLPQYEAQFKFPGDAIESAFPLWSAEKFADRVYHEVISAKKLKVNYLIGPGVWVLPIIERVVPDSLRERIFERMFRR
ncbi:MAG: SDR family NAD(P)-dependent oxidoreductase [Myxococcales bacterium]|nr:SDR family NAD(P)-dependent oxidoreductase [Myxococcales bacterium]NNK06451.1 SDR family NAD(P)-dependent oxidoreductase [Myxococcales bacterium]RZV50399.1 MAG: SDR family NAD(P)-dependent oxidoreductase [Deltaproteobacteria bacterium]